MATPRARKVATVHGPVRVRPGDLHAGETRLAYSSGQCVALAIELHRATGFRLVALCDELYGRGVGPTDSSTGMHTSAESGALAGGFSHAGVLTPAGELLDINGVRPLPDALAQWDAGFEPAARQTEDCECGERCICTHCCHPSACMSVAIIEQGDLHEIWAPLGQGVEPDYAMAATMVRPPLDEWDLSDHLR